MSFRCVMSVRALGMLAIMCATMMVTRETRAATVYTYDTLGRLVAIVYDNGIGVTYSYDQSGNQTFSQVVTCGTGPLTWGGGTWGCSTWQAQ